MGSKNCKSQCRASTPKTAEIPESRRGSPWPKRWEASAATLPLPTTSTSCSELRSSFGHLRPLLLSSHMRACPLGSTKGLCRCFCHWHTPASVKSTAAPASFASSFLNQGKDGGLPSKVPHSAAFLIARRWAKQAQSGASPKGACSDCIDEQTISDNRWQV